MDYEVQRSARRCATSGREFAPGEKFYSALVVEGAELRRYDYAVEAWQRRPRARSAGGSRSSPTPARQAVARGAERRALAVLR